MARNPVAKPIYRRVIAAACVAAATLAQPAAALAQSAGSKGADDSGSGAGYVFVGAGYLPDYTGSNHHRVVPYVEGRVNRGNRYVAFEGGKLRVNIVDAPNLHAGPMLGYRRGRENVADDAVARMAPLSHSFSAGGFVEYERKGTDPRYGEQVRLSAGQAFAGASSGFAVTFRALAYRPLKFVDRGLIATAEVDALWGDDKYMQRKFDVDAADAAASGLPRFRAHSGVATVGVAGALDQYLSRKWSVGLRARYGRLLGDAADSPVTRIAGSRNQAFIGIAVGYVL